MTAVGWGLSKTKGCKKKKLSQTANVGQFLLLTSLKSIIRSLRMCFCNNLHSCFFTRSGGQGTPEVKGHGTRMPEARGCCHFAIIILLEFGGQLDVRAFCISNAQKQVIACAMPPRSP